jgi:IS605 OrfB family transposase
MPTSHVATYQGRLVLTPEQEAFLSDYGTRYNHIERKLYAEMRSAGISAAKFKNEYLGRFGITARQFNAIGRNLEGKIASVKELLPLRKQETEIRITKAKKVISKIKSPAKLHQKRRRLHSMETRLAAIKAQIEADDPRICFGSRKLYQQQFSLAENGYPDHRFWLADWRAKRESQFYVLGSKDETTGCQGCTVTANLDGTFNLKVRSLSKEATYSTIANVAIPYGQDLIRDALRHPQAISYRFLRDAKGWRVLVTTALPEIAIRSVKAAGAIGIDINADCLAIGEINRHGNLVASDIISLVTYGKTSDQTEALIGEVVKEVVARAVKVAKPIVIEELDFAKKIAALEQENPKQARMLSSLAYNGIIRAIRSRAYRFGIEVIEVKPNYTSVIGLINYSSQEGISVHQAAALAIARRGCGFRERPTMAVEVTVPTAKGDHVTFPLPVRNRRKHVWSLWLNAKKHLEAVLAAHFRPPARGDPSRLVVPLKRKRPIYTVKPRIANRQQHCLAGVMDDIPW